MDSFNPHFFSQFFCIPQVIEKLPTPFYIYHQDKIINNLKFLTDIFSQKVPQKVVIRYAIKANSNRYLLQLIRSQGAGADVVSGGELERSLQAGFLPQEIIFSGIGKTEEELNFAIQQKIGHINVESLQELQRIVSLGKPTNICLRVCPEVNVPTHNKIATGRAGDKFGISLSQISEAFDILTKASFVTFKGFAIHIGSQISDIKAYGQSFKVLAQLLKEVPQNFPVECLDLGGGFSVPYFSHEEPFNWNQYISALNNELSHFKGHFIIEPGRFLVAEAGIILTKILYMKETPSKVFVIVDAGMNDMMRTAMYNAYHSIVSCKVPTTNNTRIVDIVGPVCESSDFFAKNIAMPADLKAGDYLAMTHCGAYCSSFASSLNSRPLLPEVLIHENQPYLIRHSIPIQTLTSFEIYRPL